MDRISNLPDHVIDRILCALPLLEAVKTCVLARVWRHRWMTLPELILDDEFWNPIPDDENVEVYTSILLQHIGKLHKLHVSVPWISLKKCKVLISSIQYALRKGVTRLSIEYYPGYLPSCIYSSVQLTHLEIAKGGFFAPTVFSGLPNLISFTLNQDAEADADIIASFIFKCSNIQTISLWVDLNKDLRIHAPKLEFLSVRGLILRICFLETKNLRTLNLGFLENVPDDVPHAEKCHMNLNILVKLERLSLKGESFEVFVSSGVPRTLSQRFDQLKILELGHIDLRQSEKLRALLFLFACSPNLYKLSVNDGEPSGYEYLHYDGEEIDFESCIDLHRDHKFQTLRTVDYFTKGFEVDVKMIGFLLRCSPCLETMSISCDFEDVGDMISCDFEDVNCDFEDVGDMLKEVMKLTRASPKASVKFL